MTEKKTLKVATATDKSDHVSVRMYRKDYEAVLKLCTQLRSDFVDLAIEQGVSIHGGRCNNLPTQSDALHFLVSNASYDESDIEQSAFSLLEAVA